VCLRLEAGKPSTGARKNIPVKLKLKLKLNLPCPPRRSVMARGPKALHRGYKGHRPSAGASNEAPGRALFC